MVAIYRKIPVGLLEGSLEDISLAAGPQEDDMPQLTPAGEEGR